MHLRKRARVILTLFAVAASQWAAAEMDSSYIWDSELSWLPEQQCEFVEDVVSAFRRSDKELGRSRLHSDVLENTDCANRFLEIFEMSTVKEQYAVKVKPGKKPDSLYFSIRHQNKGEDSKWDFLKFKDVVEQDGRLVIYVNSCVKQ